MAMIMVTASQLKNAANELRALNGQFKTQTGTLESLEASLRTSWQGQANDAFHNAFMNDKAQLENFYETIEKYCQAIETIAQKYEQAEAMNSNTASTRTY